MSVNPKLKHSIAFEKFCDHHMTDMKTVDHFFRLIPYNTQQNNSAYPVVESNKAHLLNIFPLLLLLFWCTLTFPGCFHFLLLYTSTLLHFIIIHNPTIHYIYLTAVVVAVVTSDFSLEKLIKYNTLLYIKPVVPDLCGLKRKRSVYSNTHSWYLSAADLPWASLKLQLKLLDYLVNTHVSF